MQEHDPILAGYQDAEMHDEFMLDMIREGFRLPPDQRGEYMEDYRVIGDRIVYDDGGGLPYTVATLDDLIEQPKQMTQPAMQPEQGQESTSGIAEKAAQAGMEVYGPLSAGLLKPAMMPDFSFGALEGSLFNAPVRGGIIGIANMLDLFGVPGAREFVEETNRLTEEQLQQLQVNDDVQGAAGTVNTVGEVLGQFVGPSIGIFKGISAALNRSPALQELPEWLQTTTALIGTEMLLAAGLDSPTEPTIANMMGLRDTTRFAGKTRGILEEAGMQNAQPYYDMIVDALTFEEDDPEYEKRWAKISEGLLLLGVGAGAVSLFITTLKNYKKAIPTILLSTSADEPVAEASDDNAMEQQEAETVGAEIAEGLEEMEPVDSKTQIDIIDAIEEVIDETADSRQLDLLDEAKNGS